MRLFSAAAHCMTDPIRIRMFLALRQRPLCVCQLIELIKIPPTIMSKHLAMMKKARLVSGVRKGRWIYYHLQRDSDLARHTLAWAQKSLATDPIILEDGTVLALVMKEDPECLCERQAKASGSLSRACGRDCTAPLKKAKSRSR